ncbi:hypothetical protein J7K27_04820 [Candidatus Bathyarchaeota archaeon]|nr:hypothetical protein [Candidatus Bathyarchaeota archaeon]
MRFSYQLIVDFIRRHKNTFLLIIVVALITALLQTLISVWLSRNNKISLPSFGTIYTLQAEVYGGSLKELNNGQKFIDWGTVYPGTTVHRTFNVMSKSNVEAKLIIKAMNWVFNNSRGEIVKGPTNETYYMTLIASLNETLMNPNQSLEVTLTLMVSNSNDFINLIIENKVTSFSFDIYIYMSKPNAT